ncbi:MAG: sulfatase-like hydrolase/transferase [Verrucomicrobiota bacterium]
MRNQRPYSLAGVALIAALSLLVSNSIRANDNILFVMIDDWGVDASPVHNTDENAHLAHMPNLQLLADSGMTFNRFYVGPMCSPTRASVMTGMLPHQTSIYTAGHGDSFNADNPATTHTLPKVFASAGAPHEMGLIGKWHLGGGNTAYSTIAGWHSFMGTNANINDFEYWRKNENGVVSETEYQTTYATFEQAEDAIDFIVTADDNPWFCWLAFNAPHAPFHDPPAAQAHDPIQGYSPRGADESNTLYRYRKALEALDNNLGEVLRYVDLSTTHVVVIGDNGTPNSAYQGPYSRAKGSLLESGIRVPLIVAGPAIGRRKVGDASDDLVQMIDLFPTFMEMAGLDPAVDASSIVHQQASSIVPLLGGQRGGNRNMVTEGGDGSERGRVVISGRFPDHKLVIYKDPTNPNSIADFKFYDLSEDDNESQPMDITQLSGTDARAFRLCKRIDQSLGGFTVRSDYP